MIRPAGPGDVRFLTDMLRHAYYWQVGKDPDRPVARYVRGWGRPGDAGVIAVEPSGPVGAAWYRVFKEEDAGFGFVDEQTPELTIAVVPSHRGHGGGAELLQALLDRARDGKLRTEDLADGTFTISNLGMPQYGIEQFVAVLNPPQAAILAVGATEDRPVVSGGELVMRPLMTMTITVDHRAVDGAQGADFLRTVKQFVEEPALAL